MNATTQTTAAAQEVESLIENGTIKNVALLIFVLVMIATGAGVYLVAAKYIPLIIATLGQAFGLAAAVASGLAVVALIGFLANKYSKPLATKVVEGYTWAKAKVASLLTKKADKTEVSADAAVAAA